MLSSPLVPEPVHYRYAWARSPLGNLQVAGNTDIPFATQRSDSWSMNDMYEALTGKTSQTAGSLERGERAELLKALRAEDGKRRIAAARALIEVTAKEP